ncbi:MAG TPA: hypothetical protein VKV15_04145 [Bryobacteraceae bacterium]|nr:hypothetical protein [Bryobacteraceae bacterium]
MARKLLLLLSLATVLSLAQTDATTTGGMLNGRAWQAAGRDARLMYVRGIEEGLVLAAGLVSCKPDEDILLKHPAPEFHPSDYIDEINAFYQKSSNIRIPIFYAWEYANARFEGASQQQLDSLMQSFNAYVGKH